MVNFSNKQKGLPSYLHKHTSVTHAYLHPQNGTWPREVVSPAIATNGTPMPGQNTFRININCNFKLQIANCKLQIGKLRNWRIVESRKWKINGKLQIANCKLQIANCKLQFQIGHGHGLKHRQGPGRYSLLSSCLVCNAQAPWANMAFINNHINQKNMQYKATPKDGPILPRPSPDTLMLPSPCPGATDGALVLSSPCTTDNAMCTGAHISWHQWRCTDALFSRHHMMVHWCSIFLAPLTVH